MICLNPFNSHTIDRLLVFFCQFGFNDNRLIFLVCHLVVLLAMYLVGNQMHPSLSMEFGKMIAAEPLVKTWYHLPVLRLDLMWI